MILTEVALSLDGVIGSVASVASLLFFLKEWGNKRRQADVSLIFLDGLFLYTGRLGRQVRNGGTILSKGLANADDAKICENDQIMELRAIIETSEGYGFIGGFNDK